MQFDQIAQKGVLAIGRVGMDLTPHPANTRTQDATEMMVAMGGSAANIAAGLSKLGYRAALLTCVSDDAVGWYCLNQLDHYGIDRTHVMVIKGEARTSLAVYETRMDDHQSVIYRNNAADFQLSVAQVEAVDFSLYGALITTGTVFAAEPSRSAAFHALDLARAVGLPIIFDVDYRPYSWPSAAEAQSVLSRAAAMAQIIVGNDEEFGFMAQGIAKGFDKARDLARSAAIVVYKLGPKGSVTFHDGAETRTGIFAVTSLKPTGAGDSFMAGFVASLAEGRAVPDAVLRGSACASVVVARPGCAPAMPTPSELAAFLVSHPGVTAFSKDS